jgi:hypothetical protein
MPYSKPCLLRHALLCACLTLLSGCSAPQVVTLVQVETLSPPADLIPECAEPEFLGYSYGDAVDHAEALQGAFAVCHKEIDALNKWVTQHRDATN